MVVGRRAARERRVAAAGDEARAAELAELAEARAVATPTADLIGRAAAARLADYIRRTVDAAPAFTEEQRDELLAALNESLECGEDGDWQSARRVISAAISSVKGGSA